MKYLVIRTPMMKERIGKESGVAAKHDFGWWSVFELKDEPAPHVRVLPYRPALVVSRFTLKSRRQNELSFIRLTEEQFADNWFDVLLVRSPENRIDRLRNLERFGALVLDTYDYDDENRAFERLRDFAQDRQLILLSSDDHLFKRIQAARGEFPMLEIIERQAEEPGEILEAVRPTRPYASSAIRQLWKAIRSVLERGKVPIESASTQITSERGQNTIQLQLNQVAQASEVPILINTTYHPNWRRGDGGNIYAATPFNMLTFISHPVNLSYERRSVDRAGLWISTGAVILLCLFMVWYYSRRFN